jgi:hypothetical protein
MGGHGPALPYLLSQRVAKAGNKQRCITAMGSGQERAEI